jgi:hypothetical protein
MKITIKDIDEKSEGAYNNLHHFKIADLIYHEGPLLSLMCDNDGNTFLYKWLGCNDIKNSWLVLQVTSQELINFFNKQKSLRDLCLENAEAIVIEINDELEIDLSAITVYIKIPSHYLPKESSFYDENIYTESAECIRNTWTYNLVKTSDEKIDWIGYVKSISQDTEVECVAEAI